MYTLHSPIGATDKAAAQIREQRERETHAKEKEEEGSVIGGVKERLTL